MPSQAEALRAQWIAEMDDFKLMTWAAQRGYKHMCGGHPDRYDMEAYDNEADECVRLLSVLSAIVFPPGATPEAARAAANVALEHSRSTANQEGGSLSRQFEWARAVVEGGAERFWNSYHPRHQRKPQ